MRIETSDAPGEKTAGVDLGISNTVVVSIGDETLLSPDNVLKEVLTTSTQEYATEGKSGSSQTAQWGTPKEGPTTASVPACCVEGYSRAVCCSWC